MDTITAIIPAYNEEHHIQGTLEIAGRYVDELLVIDDASTDRTFEIASASGARVLRQMVNRGYLQAIKRGFVEATGDLVVTLDADGELPAQAIPRLVQPIIDGHADMVQGHRDIIPRPSEQFITWLARKKADVGDSGSGLRALRTELARRLELKGVCICGVFALEVIAKKGRIAEVPIRLNKVGKPRSIAWSHIAQVFYLLPWLFRNLEANTG